jgi:hypothetical protein
MPFGAALTPPRGAAIDAGFMTGQTLYGAPSVGTVPV